MLPNKKLCQLVVYQNNRHSALQWIIPWLYLCPLARFCKSMPFEKSKRTKTRKNSMKNTGQLHSYPDQNYRYQNNPPKSLDLSKLIQLLTVLSLPVASRDRPYSASTDARLLLRTEARGPPVALTGMAPVVYGLLATMGHRTGLRLPKLKCWVQQSYNGQGDPPGQTLSSSSSVFSEILIQNKFRGTKYVYIDKASRSHE